MVRFSAITMMFSGTIVMFRANDHHYEILYLILIQYRGTNYT